MIPKDKVRLDNMTRLGKAAFVDGNGLDDLLSGAVILGAEPVSYPYVDGLVLYLRGLNGDYFELDLDCDVDNCDDCRGFPVLRITKTDDDGTLAAEYGR